MEDKEKIELLEEIVRLQKEIIALRANPSIPYIPYQPSCPPYVAPPYWEWPTVICESRS